MFTKNTNTLRIIENDWIIIENWKIADKTQYLLTRLVMNITLKIKDFQWTALHSDFIIAL